MANTLRLGDLLISAGLITQEQLEKAITLQKENKKRLGAELVDLGYITEKQLIDALQLQLGVEFVDLSNVVISPEMAKVLPKTLAKKYSVVPVRVARDTLFLAMSDPLNFIAMENVKKATKKKVIPMIAMESAVERSIAMLYGSEGAARAIEEMKRDIIGNDFGESSFSNIISDDEKTAPTIRLVNSIIERAVVERASDIHFEPNDGEMRVRMRIDGVLRNILSVPKDLQSAVISRMKVMGSMDISERKIPQDGRANIRIKQEVIDLRLSTLPTIYGEKFVIRLLDKNSQFLNKSKIGLEEDDLVKYMHLVKNNSGVILIVGPTGSGKSSTMYTMIKELNTEQVNLITLEDPVEYNMDGVNQVQINEKTGMTFANGLRSVLRQDPDIIAVGEIRDGETAEIAMRAAITGHLVISTVHTNDAVSTIDRLVDIGVPPYLIASALKGIISQRLVRRICPNCREEYTPSDEELVDIGMTLEPGQKIFRGKGCPVCFHTGYRGRTGVFEILILNRNLKNAITSGRTNEEIREIAEKGDFTTLAENCFRLVKKGFTTTEEARRIINSADV